MLLIDNKLQVAKIRLTFILTFVAGTLLILYALFTKGHSDGKMLSLVAGIIAVVIFLYLLIIKPEYIFFSIENNNKLVVRNYTAFPLFRKYKAYEIPLSSIFDYEIKKVFFDRIVFIRILVKSKNKVGKYPWLSLSIIPKNDLNNLYKSLDKILPPEMRKKVK